MFQLEYNTTTLIGGILGLKCFVYVAIYKNETLKIFSAMSSSYISSICTEFSFASLLRKNFQMLNTLKLQYEQLSDECW